MANNLRIVFLLLFNGKHSITDLPFQVNSCVVVFIQLLYIHNIVNKCMIIVDFSEFGPVAPRAIDPHDLAEILASSQALLEDFDEEAIVEFLCDTTAALMWRSISEEHVDTDWYDRAAIVLCMRGLRGELRPKFLNFSSED